MANADLISKIRSEYAPRERIELRTEYEKKANEKILESIDSLSWESFEEIISLINTDIWVGQISNSRFHPTFSIPNMNLMKSHDISEIKTLFVTAFVNEDASKIDEVVSNIKGINYAAASLLFYIKNSDRYNAFFPVTLRGLKLVYPEKTKELRYSKPFEENYKLFNSLCGDLKKEFSLGPQELDIVLTILGQRGLEYQDNGKVEPVPDKSTKSYWIFYNKNKGDCEKRTKDLFYPFHSNCSNYKVLVDKWRKGDVVLFYCPSEFVAELQISNVEEVPKEQLNKEEFAEWAAGKRKVYRAIFSKIKHFDPPIGLTDEIKNELLGGKGSFFGRSLLPITEEMYNRITKYPPKQSFLIEPLNLKRNDLSLEKLLFENKEELLSQIYAALKSGKNLMLLGPPGTGKTEIALALCKIAKNKNYINDFVLTTATSDWTTFDTIGGYVPEKEGKCLEFIPGQFLKCFREGNNPTNKWLVIDEINRSDIDKAFGQLFTVLSGQSVDLPFQTQKGSLRITPADNWVENEVGLEQYVVPKSWRLLATLNTYDKTSLYQMSYAFMRRFAFINVNVPSSNFIDLNWNNYLLCWGIEITGPLAPIAEDLKNFWKEMNQKDCDRRLGPAVIKDMLELIIAQGDDIENLNDNQRKILMTSAVEAYILPQFEGLEKDKLNLLKEKLDKYCIPEKIEALIAEFFSQ